MKSFLFIVGFLALFFSASVVCAEEVSVKVVPSEVQPSPELPFIGAYTPFTSFDIEFSENDSFGGIFLRSIPLEVNFFDENGAVICDESLKVENFLSAIVVVADPSPGNIAVIEKKIIAYKRIIKTNKGKINLFVPSFYCSNNAKFTFLGIPKGPQNIHIKIGINILGLKYSQLPDSEIHKAKGLPFGIDVGTKQPIGTYGEAPHVKVSWSLPSSSGRGFRVDVWGKDVRLGKIFINSVSEMAILRVIPDSEENDYLCESDGGNIISTDFKGGIEISQGKSLFVYCKDDKDLLKPKSATLINIIFYAVSGRLLIPTK